MANVVIDGSMYEGGGQILRNAIAISAVCNIKLEVNNIRAGRPKPGLSNQHITGLELASELCGGQLKGCISRSSSITFNPVHIRTGDFSCDTRTAGSIALVMQVCIPILAFGKLESTVSICGGTDAAFAPPVDYITEVTAFYYEKLGLRFDVEILQRGYYPQGGGSARLKVYPVDETLSPIDLTDIGTVVRISGYAFVAGKVPLKVANEMCAVGRNVLRNYFPNAAIEIDSFKASDNSFKASASAFLFIVHTSTNCRLGVSRIGSPRGPSVRQLVTEAIEEELIYCTRAGACCDTKMQDQLILPMALAKGTSRLLTTYPLTLHSQSAIYVAESMLPSVKFDIKEIPGQGAAILSCTGIGFEQQR